MIGWVLRPCCCRVCTLLQTNIFITFRAFLHCKRVKVVKELGQENCNFRYGFVRPNQLPHFGLAVTLNKYQLQYFSQLSNKSETFTSSLLVGSHVSSLVQSFCCNLGKKCHLLPTAYVKRGSQVGREGDLGL